MFPMAHMGPPPQAAHQGQGGGDQQHQNPIQAAMQQAAEMIMGGAFGGPRHPAQDEEDDEDDDDDMDEMPDLIPHDADPARRAMEAEAAEQVD